MKLLGDAMERVEKCDAHFIENGESFLIKLNHFKKNNTQSMRKLQQYLVVKKSILAKLWEVVEVIKQIEESSILRMVSTQNSQTTVKTSMGSTSLNALSWFE